MGKSIQIWDSNENVGMRLKWIINYGIFFHSLAFSLSLCVWSVWIENEHRKYGKDGHFFLVSFSKTPKFGSIHLTNAWSLV